MSIALILLLNWVYQSLAKWMLLVLDLIHLAFSNSDPSNLNTPYFKRSYLWKATLHIMLQMQSWPQLYKSEGN